MCTCLNWIVVHFASSHIKQKHTLLFSSLQSKFWTLFIHNRIYNARKFNHAHRRWLTHRHSTYYSPLLILFKKKSFLLLHHSQAEMTSVHGRSSVMCIEIRHKEIIPDIWQMFWRIFKSAYLRHESFFSNWTSFIFTNNTFI
jgi:hypothetical protein